MVEKIKKILNKKNIVWINEHYQLFCLYEALALNLILEIICRHSLFSALLYFIRRPVMFLFNALILLLFLEAGALLRRRIMFNAIVSILVLALGITNGILLCFRTTPFAAVDFLLITSAIRIVKLYLSPAVIILILLAILLAIALSVFLGFKMPKYEGKIHALFTAAMLVVYMFSLIGLNNLLVFCGVATENFSNLADAYRDYGFPYCFANSIINLGMDKPKGYSQEKVEDVAAELFNAKLPINPLRPYQHGESAGDSSGNSAGNSGGQDGSVANTPDPDQETMQGVEGEQAAGRPKDDRLPNIIFVQLESFFDPYTVRGLEFSQDPIPYYRELTKRFSTGWLYVPSVGAGTANTEFEILTGMNLDFFGPGEYPYKTILKSTTCESIANNLRVLGYAAHAIHNNDGTFYDRHIVFSQLGFDTFTPIEYMYQVERNVNGFAKDGILVGEIGKALDSTEGSDTIYAISVQAHGEYPSKRLEDEEPIFIRYTDQDMEYAWSYYVNQIAEDDRFIRDLVRALEERDEPSILVLYGDHLPHMNLDSQDVEGETLTATRYVIWDNIGLEKRDQDLEAYQLSAMTLERAGIAQGILTQLHQNCHQDDDYMEKLEVLQYDMLYGNREIYGGVNPYPATALQMGIEEIAVNAVKLDEGIVHIYGKGFNEYSCVCVNGDVKQTLYVEKGMLLVDGITLSEGDLVTVAQIGTDNQILGQTENYRYE